MTTTLATDVAWSQSQTDRITIALIPAVQADLRRLRDSTNLSTTDLANRAITSYAFFDAHLRAGHDVFVRDNTTGQTHRVRFR